MDFDTDEEIIESIDSSLNSIGRSIAYAVYLNWAAVDKDRRGIVRDPKAFIATVHDIFGNVNGPLVEALLCRELRKHFRYLELTDASVESSSNNNGGFESLIQKIRRKAKSMSGED